MNQLKVIEKNDHLVLTSAQLAESLGTDMYRISHNFNYNKSRYEEGKHYFALTGEDRKQFINDNEIHASLKKVHTIYLWTKKGAFLHVKSINSNQAWEAYSELIDDYFNKVDQLQRMNIPQKIPNSMEELMLMAAQNMVDVRHEINQIKEENRKLKLVVDNEIYLTENQKAEIQEAVKKRVGQLMKKGFESHFQSIYSALKVFFTVPKYDKILRKDYDAAIEFIAGWYPKKAEEIQ